jgi:TRAP transporter 4TM/12TM fusion protein
MSGRGDADDRAALGMPAAALDQNTQQKLEELVEEEEGATNRLRGWVYNVVTALAVFVSLYHLYGAYDVIAAHILRPVHVLAVMVLVFLLFPIARRFRDSLHWWDLLPAALSLGVLAYILSQGETFGDRATAPTTTDFAVGVLFIVLLLEATRRATGWIMPGVAMVFLLYAMYGNYLPRPWTHRGYGFDDLVAHLYMTLEGIFGTTVDVASSLIILFTIYGAVLQYSGAGKFFIDFSFAAMGGRRNSAGRAVVLSSFLMGGPSGSGVATTVAIGTVAYPLLAKAGYEKNAAGGLLAAGGLGAIISPPVLGAAAFLIAEFLKISYFDVILMATIPTLLYYLSIFVMVELDAARYGGGSEVILETGSLWQLTKSYWFHFSSLVAIIAFMLVGYSPTLAVFWSIVLAAAVSYLRPDTALVPSKALLALRDGTVGVLNVAATCATAGIIVGVVTLTGLAQRFADIIIGYAQGSLLLTAFFTAAIVWVVGLAVPVTASYIMCAVIAAPALIKLGVPDFAAHMFIFYYAVLSEVSPPTALSPFAAAAITGGNPYVTTMQAWKYTMPAFLVPFVFILDPDGVGLLLKFPKGGGWLEIVLVTIETAAGIAALAFAFQRRLFRRNTILETTLFALAGIILVFPGVLEAAASIVIGREPPHSPLLALAVIASAVVMQHLRKA